MIFPNKDLIQRSILFLSYNIFCFVNEHLIALQRSFCFRQILILSMLQACSG